MPGIATRKHVAAMLRMDASPNYLRCPQNAAMRDRTAKRRTQGDDRSYIRGPLCRYRAGDNSSQTVADEMQLAATFAQCLLDCVIQLMPDKQVRTLGVEAYS